MQYQLSQNQIHLNNYLLSGDTSEAEKVLAGVAVRDSAIHMLREAATPEERAALARLNQVDHDWEHNFARPLIEKRKEVDAGNATVAELQIFYLQQNPGDWITKVKDPVDETMAATESVLREQQLRDARATIITSVLSGLCFVLALGGGIAIAYYTANSITEPLMHLMKVAREIGESGDLDQQIDIHRADEVGELSKSFSRMIAYLKEMASV